MAGTTRASSGLASWYCGRGRRVVRGKKSGGRGRRMVGK